jgi:exosortase/archaeosortase family protein
LLLPVASAGDPLSSATQPAAVALLRLVGKPAIIRADSLEIGALSVPWSQDCSGLNFLVVLWAIAAWSRRFEGGVGRYCAALALAVLAGFVANLGRIFCIIGYRTAFFPGTESAEAHYFLGFLWLLAATPLVLGGSRGKSDLPLGEALYLAALLSLLIPIAAGPGGALAVACALAIAVHGHPRAPTPLAMTLWILVALPIGWSRMESLWAPWLLVCPTYVSRRLLRSPATYVLLAGTLPLVAMSASLRGLLGMVLGYQAWRFYRDGPEGTKPRGPLPWGLHLVTGLMLFAPFCVGSLDRSSQFAPPPGVMAREFPGGGYEVRLLGQTPSLRLSWFGQSRSGRHHALQVCIRYRGVRLEPVEATPQVSTDGRFWMREFFLWRDEVVTTYPDYILRSVVTGAEPWVHVIAAAPVHSMSAEEFAARTSLRALELSELERRGGDLAASGPNRPGCAERSSS